MATAEDMELTYTGGRSSSRNKGNNTEKRDNYTELYFWISPSYKA